MKATSGNHAASRPRSMPGAAEGSSGLRLAVASQTPLIRFTEDVAVPDGEAAVPLAELDPGTWKYSTGGVTRMLKPLLERWARAGFTRRVEWVTLQREAAPPVAFNGFRTSFVHLSTAERERYVKVKEALWALLNGLPEAPDDPADLPRDAWEGFRTYAARTARHVSSVEAASRGFDVVYVHDFQLLPLAGEAPASHPAVFHLHTPFPSDVSPAWADYFADTLAPYDHVVVSSRAYARGLRDAGYHGALSVVYPFVDPADYPVATDAQVRAFRRRYGLAADDRIILNVARMDPMKSQDRLVHALPRILEREPRARLVLVGNGSFSNSASGGLGLSKGARWRRRLESLARELDVADRVTFTGHVEDDEIPAAYAVARAFALPSVREGFGLAVVESWLYGVPAVVSHGAGVRELVKDGENGFVVDSADAAALADALVEILDLPPDRRELFAESGREAARLATLPEGRGRIQSVLAEATGREVLQE